jgi:hypothetical protein
MQFVLKVESREFLASGGKKAKEQKKAPTSNG